MEKQPCLKTAELQPPTVQQQQKLTGSLRIISTGPELTKILIHDFDRLIILLFVAEWHEGCKALIKIFEKYAALFPEGRFVIVDADKVEQISKHFEITMVPTIVFTNGMKETLKKITEIHPPELMKTVEEQLNTFKVNFEVEKVRMFGKIDKLLAENPFIAFIKGTPQAPKCGFTETLLGIFHKLELKFAFYDILADEGTRNWLRYYSKWNTYPQIYIKGKVIGGLDVTKQLIADNKFLDMVPQEFKEDSLPQNKLDRLLKRGPIMMLIKGIPPTLAADKAADQAKEDPQKKEISDILKNLQEKNADYFYYNMEADAPLYEHVKDKGDVQFYVSEKLIGGPKEMKEYIDKNELPKRFSEVLKV